LVGSRRIYLSGWRIPPGTGSRQRQINPVAVGAGDPIHLTSKRCPLNTLQLARCRLRPAMPIIDRPGLGFTLASLPLCLTTEEIVLLTCRIRHSAQRKALQHMLVDHKQRPDGSIVVLRSALDSASGIGQSKRRTEPDYG
jgi:hypothetical protein